MAKRIEAAQLSVQQSLCGVPMLISQIERWGRELAAGNLRLGSLIDVSMHQGDAEADGIVISPGVPTPPEEDDPDAAAQREAELHHELGATLRYLGRRVRNRRPKPKANQCRSARERSFQAGSGANAGVALDLQEQDEQPLAASRPNFRAGRFSNASSGSFMRSIRK